MKNTTPFFKGGVLVAFCLLFTAIAFAQPVIKVPPTCEVVFAGTGLGASIGFGGAVGDGGIVAMPDPFDFTSSAGNFYYASDETELIGWRLFGDISMQTDTSYNEVVQPEGAVNPLNLQSYNKNLRPAEIPSESQPLLNSRWARSKGRVIVYYSSRPCKASIQFQIFKRYKHIPGSKKPSVVPPIFGSDCVLPNTIYTYSVDPIASDNANDEIGFDKYYWSGLPDGSSIVYSASDNSSITLLTGESVSDFTLQCCYGRANGWDGDAEEPALHTTCITKTVIGQPTQPNFITEPPGCLDTGLTSFGIEINPESIAAGTTYSWSAPGTNWTIDQGGVPSGQAVEVSGLDNNTGTLFLTVANNGCQPATFSFPINRNYTSPFAISGNNCVSAGSSYTYSLPGGLENPTTWTAPSGWTVSATNATASTVNIGIPGNAASGAYTLSAASVSCVGTISLTVNVRPVAPVFSTSSASCVAKGTTPVNTITIDTTVPGTPTTGYVWNLTGAPGWSIATGNGTATPTFIPNGTTSGPVTISVTLTGSGGCSSLVATRTISYIAISSALNSSTMFCDQYLASCGTVTSWVVNGTTVDPQNLPSNIGLNSSGSLLSICGNNGAVISVCANIAGVSGLVCASPVGTHGLRQAQSTITAATKFEGITISPNPNSGTFAIKISHAVGTASASISDWSGKFIGRYVLGQGDNTIENEGLASGTYTITLDVDGKTETRKIIIR
jgi:hypothetical protein